MRTGKSIFRLTNKKIKLAKLTLFILVTGLVLGCSVAPNIEDDVIIPDDTELIARGSQPLKNASGTLIKFEGNISEFTEDTTVIEGQFYYIMCFRATVETNTGVTYELNCCDLELPADPPLRLEELHRNY